MPALLPILLMTFMAIEPAAPPTAPSPPTKSSEPAEDAAPREYVLTQEPIEEVLARARTCLGPEFRTYEERYWVVLTDADYASIKHIHRDLKSTRHQFNRLCQVLGSVRPMPRHKMLCIVFRDQDAFSEFASTCGRSPSRISAAVGGFFSPLDQWIVFYEPRGIPALVEAREQIRTEREELEAYRKESERTNDAPRVEDQQRKAVESWSRHLEQQRSRLDRLEQELRTSITAHEAFHQLSWLTGFVDCRGGWGYWLHEGFATCFETDDTAYAFGPAHESTLRRDGFRAALADNELMPLRTLLTFHNFADVPPERIKVFYNQSYALVRWLYRFRRTQLNNYLRSLRERADLEFPADYVRAFEDSFGPIERLERRWLRDEIDQWNASRRDP
ncbi:MAG: DUF1570 domain-containing protein [Planctomycetota bacterium]|nr:DUF1570 domain-containing protein [Planctomycetota bacterium]